MLAAIHQPQYLPWLGYFDKINKADIFILLDNVQFKKNEWQNRNRIRTAQQWQWLTVPVIHNFGQLIAEVKINNQVKWRKAHLQAIELNYRRAPFFEEYIGYFQKIYGREWEKLADINIAVIKKIVELLGIKTPILTAADYKVTGASTQRLIDLCENVGADAYLSGIDGKKYMDFDKFVENNIRVEIQDFVHPVYPQLWADKKEEKFISHLSIVDLLFNCGKDSLKLFDSESLSSL